MSWRPPGHSLCMRGDTESAWDGAVPDSGAVPARATDLLPNSRQWRAGCARLAREALARRPGAPTSPEDQEAPVDSESPRLPTARPNVPLADAHAMKHTRHRSVTNAEYAAAVYPVLFSFTPCRHGARVLVNVAQANARATKRMAH
ncbi:hypothetical protein B0H16DRAFT_1894200 [Mycena metata]|uniref:Uncharacterized protein n=1 Tax=Mycena metata TaxID=1033252 RepID=A0AAD7MQC2_9AGAR|nr:hypothetical protein B0H16DRAFT_1894200 [Mycena metata]